MLAGGIGLLAAGLADTTLVQRVLAAQAPDGTVNLPYVETVQLRALWCGTALLLIVGVRRLCRRFLDQPDAPTPATPAFADLPIAILLIAAAARLALIARPLRYDEAFTLSEFASRSPLFFLSSYTHANNHVLHTLLVWLMPGSAVPLLRLPALLAGIAVIAATYLLARQLHDRATAILAAALAAGATPLVEYSAQARGYTILTLCVLGLYLVTPRLERRWRTAALLIALGGWTMPPMIYACAAWAAWVVATRRPVPWRGLVASAAAGAALAFLLYVPILVISGPASIIANGNVLPVSFAVLVRELPRSIAETWRQWHLSFTAAGGIVLGALAIATIVRERGRNAFAIALAAVLLLTIVMRRVPFPRIWIFLVPLYLIAAANALATVTRRRATLAIGVSIALLASLGAIHATSRRSFFEDPAMRDAPAVAAWIRANVPPDAQVLVTSPLDAPFAFYLRGRPLVRHRFDSDPAQVKASFTAPRRFFIASRRPGGLDEYRALGIAGRLQPVRSFEHAIVYEIR